MVATYPNLAEWQTLQGGEPVMLGNEPSTVFQIVHVYDQNRTDEHQLPRFSDELAAKIGHYGCIIDTPVIQINSSVNNPTGKIFQSHSRVAEVIFPATMSINHHGKPCSDRSALAGEKTGYAKIESEKDWNRYLKQKANEDWELWHIEQVVGTEKLLLKVSAKIADLLVK